MFQVCHFHYWLAKCIKSDRCWPTAGWPHIELLPSLGQRQDSISALCGCHPGNEKLQIKILPREGFFTKLCISPGKIMSMESFQLQTAQDIHRNPRSLLHQYISVDSLQLPTLSLARWASHKLLCSSAKLIGLNTRSKAWDILTMFILFAFCTPRQHQKLSHLQILF